MKRYQEDEYLMLSGLQHFVFCRRQWALIHIEQQWEENYRTVDGSIMHRKAHDSSFHEKRGDLIISRGMAISSPTLGISGECDVVEFHRSSNGISLQGLEGTYDIVPVEYKRGEAKEDESDKMQLTAQAMCLEEMLCCEIPKGYLYYGETRHRLEIVFDAELRIRTQNAIEEMHGYYQRGYTPQAKRTKACNACSLKNICLPVLGKKRLASEYMKRKLTEDNDEETT